MNLARGAPPRFESAALLLLEQIGKLKDGKVTISDAGVSAVRHGARSGWPGSDRRGPEKSARWVQGRRQRVAAPPYVFQANKDPVAVTLTLTGYVPDNNVHAAMVAAAQRKFFSEKVVDNLKASIGAPKDFAEP